MNILLLSMPDSFEHMPTVAVRMPNGALTSLAGNIDPHHKVAVADLILVQDKVRETVERLVREHQPDVVGLSVMTFQRKTALQIIAPAALAAARGSQSWSAATIPAWRPKPTWRAAAASTSSFAAKAKLTFRELLRAMETATDFGSILGLYLPRRRRLARKSCRARCTAWTATRFACPSAMPAC